MTTIRKHWISLKQAQEEQRGWNSKWYAWYYPYSKWIRIIKVSVGIGGGLLILSILAQF